MSALKNLDFAFSLLMTDVYSLMRLVNSVGPSSSTLATLAKDEFFKVEAQTKH